MPPSRIGGTIRYVAVLLILAAILVVRLGVKVDRLEERISVLQERAYTAYPGSYVPSFSTTTLEGTDVVLGESFEQGRQVLFLLTTTCLYCRASLPAWQRIAQAADTFSAVPIRAFGVSIDSVDATRRYARDHGIGFDMVVLPRGKMTSLYRARSVPQTIILDGDGRVLYSRVGVLESPAAIDSVIGYLGAPVQ